MSKLRLATVGVLLILVVTWGFAQTKDSKTSQMPHRMHVAMSPDEIKWGPAPPALPPGAELAVLSGDPSKTGDAFVMRVKFPDGYTVPPHWHPTDENVVVLQGAVMLGMGEKFDLTKARELPVGSYALMPSGARHFAQAKGETILNISGIGPFALNYVNAADDPRNKKPTN